MPVRGENVIFLAEGQFIGFQCDVKDAYSMFIPLLALQVDTLSAIKEANKASAKSKGLMMPVIGESPSVGPTKLKTGKVSCRSVLNLKKHQKYFSLIPCKQESVW